MTTSKYNLTTATPDDIAAHAVKAIRSQGRQEGNLHADLRALVEQKAFDQIENMVKLFASELEADKKSCAASNKTLRLSIKAKCEKQGLTGDDLKAAVKEQFESSPDRRTASYINWDNMRRAIERANGKAVKTTIKTDGTYQTEDKPETAASPAKSAKSAKSELLTSAETVDKIRALLGDLVAIDALPEINALTAEFVEARNKLADAKKAKKAA